MAWPKSKTKESDATKFRNEQRYKWLSWGWVFFGFLAAVTLVLTHVFDSFREKTWEQMMKFNLLVGGMGLYAFQSFYTVRNRMEAKEKQRKASSAAAVNQKLPPERHPATKREEK